MAGNGNRKGDDALVLALARGAAIKDAAAAACIGERTAHRRLDDPSFRQRVNAARDELFQRAMSRLAEAATEAAATLRDLLHTDSPMVRLGAARAILEYGPKLREFCELEIRVSELEQRVCVYIPENGRGNTGVNGKPRLNGQLH